MSTIKLALDWTPNINHIGFFVAQALDFYKDEGLNVEISHPGQDNYTLTPAKKVELGEADFAICPLESILSYRTKSKPFALIAAAAILQQDVSAVAVTKTAKVASPKDLDNKIYASYEARYEDEIIRQMIINDGGNGSINVSYPNKLEIWEHLLTNKADATWIFMNWEGVAKEAKQEELSYFALGDYNIPYGYSPVLACDENALSTKTDEYARFMKANTKGFLFCQKSPEQAVDILSDFLLPADKHIDLVKCLDITMQACFDEQGRWGYMSEARVDTFLKWLYQHQLEKRLFTPAQVSTNQFVK